jgi:hypothetical protein
MPIHVYDTAFKEQTGKEVLEKSWMKMNPFEIESYRPGKLYEDEGTTIINTKAGDCVVVLWSLEEFEKRVNNFVK